MAYRTTWIAPVIATIFLSSCYSQWCSSRLKSSYSPWISENNHRINKIPQCSEAHYNLVAGRLVNGSSPREENLLPPWINLALARQGQKWALDHLPMIAISHIFGLMSLLAFPDINAVLLFTNQSDTPDKAEKRYGSTIRSVLTWYQAPLKEDLEDNAALESLKRVRRFHTAAMFAGNERLFGERKSLVNDDLYSRVPLDDYWMAFKKDLEDSNIPRRSRIVPDSYTREDGTYYSVSQFQQAMTQFAFVGFPILFPERLLIFNTKEEDLYAFNHLWAVLGHALGIDDNYNIALQPDLISTRKYYQHIYEDWYLPNLFHLDFHAKVLLQAQLKGFEKIRDILTPRTLLLRLLRDIVNIPVPNMSNQLTLKDQYKMLQFYIQGVRGFLQRIQRKTAARQQ